MSPLWCGICAGLLEMPLLTSVAFGWPCHAQRAKPVLDWLQATAKTGSPPAPVQARQASLGQPALMAVAAATLERFFQPEAGKHKLVNTPTANRA